MLNEFTGKDTPVKFRLISSAFKRESGPAGRASDLCRCSSNSRLFLPDLLRHIQRPRQMDAALRSASCPPDGGHILTVGQWRTPMPPSFADGQRIWPDCLRLKVHLSLIFVIYSQGWLRNRWAVLPSA